jgi:predicted anti-sigma-YlaC factor YlaD
VSCERIHEQLPEFLEGRLSELERRTVEEHLAGCAACQALLETLQGTLDALAPDTGQSATVEAPPDLAGAILARTSGPACGRAQEFLCDLVDGALAPAEAELVESHVEHCTRCASLRDTLAWLRTELSQMSHLEPRPELVPAILAATVRAEPRRAAARSAIVAAAQRWWEHVVARPRFAWEAAYVATLIAVLLFGTPVSPFRGVPSRALAAVQIDPRSSAQSTGDRLRQVRDGIGGAGTAVWDATGGRAVGGVRGRASAYAAGHPGMTEAWSDLGEHSSDLRRALGARNLAEASLVMRSIGEDLGAFWKSYRAPGEAASDAAPPAR